MQPEVEMLFYSGSVLIRGSNLEELLGQTCPARNDSDSVESPSPTNIRVFNSLQCTALYWATDLQGF